MDVKKTTTSTGFKLSVMTLAIMNVTAVVSLRGLPAEAVYGLSSAFYYLFAAIVFLIPTAMVAAELAAMFADKQGGVFRWVGEAYGARTGRTFRRVFTGHKGRFLPAAEDNVRRFFKRRNRVRIRVQDGKIARGEHGAPAGKMCDICRL